MTNLAWYILKPNFLALICHTHNLDIPNLFPKKHFGLFGFLVTRFPSSSKLKHQFQWLQLNRMTKFFFAIIVFLFTLYVLYRLIIVKSIPSKRKFERMFFRSWKNAFSYEWQTLFSTCFGFLATISERTKIS